MWNLHKDMSFAAKRKHSERKIDGQFLIACVGVWKNKCCCCSLRLALHENRSKKLFCIKTLLENVDTALYLGLHPMNFTWDCCKWTLLEFTWDCILFVYSNLLETAPRELYLGLLETASSQLWLSLLEPASSELYLRWLETASSELCPGLPPVNWLGTCCIHFSSFFWILFPFPKKTFKIDDALLMHFWCTLLI